MADRRDSFKVGVATIGAVLVSFAILLWISQRVGGDTARITVRFRSTPAMPGLVKGSQVLVGGQKVGKIHATSLKKEPSKDPKSGRDTEVYFVFVEADILSSIDLRADCSIFAEGPPLGGDGLVKIDVGRSPDPWPPGKVIEGAEPGGFGAILASLQSEFNGDDPRSLLGQIKLQLDPEAKLSLMAKLQQSLSDINAMTAALSREFQPEQQASLLAKVELIAQNVSDMTTALRAEFDAKNSEVLLAKLHVTMDTINGGLESLTRTLKAGEPVIGKTLHNVQSASENIASQTDPRNTEGLMANFVVAGKKLNEVLTDINTVTGTTRDVVVLNRDNINRMLVNFKESSDHLKTGLKYVLRHPWRLLNAPKPTEMKQQAIFDAARNFADAATRIDDASAQLKALADLHDGKITSDDPDLLRLAADLKQTKEKYQKAEAELWKQLSIE